MRSAARRTSDARGEKREGVTSRYRLGVTSRCGCGGAGSRSGLAASGLRPITYTITPFGLSATNYTITFVSGTLTVTPATLVITADDVPGRLTYGLISQDQPVFASEYVRYVGEPVAAVAASRHDSYLRNGQGTGHALGQDADMRAARLSAQVALGPCPQGSTDPPTPWKVSGAKPNGAL